MSQPVIVCYFENSGRTLIGNGDHLNLLQDSGFSDDPVASDKWILGELILDENPPRVHIRGNKRVPEELYFKVEDILFKCAGDSESLMKHVSKYGYHPNLSRLLKGEAKEEIEGRASARESFLLTQSEEKDDSAIRALKEEILSELGKEWVTLFRDAKNRAYFTVFSD